jgi:hypothetical protein
MQTSLYRLPKGQLKIFEALPIFDRQMGHLLRFELLLAFSKRSADGERKT